MSSELKNEPGPVIPGFWRLGWMLLMQPLRLYMLLDELETPHERRNQLLRLLAWQCFLCVGVALPVIVTVLSGALYGLGVPIEWSGVVTGLAISMPYCIGAVAFNAFPGVALTLASSVAHVITCGLTVGLTLAIAGVEFSGLIRMFAFSSAFGAAQAFVGFILVTMEGGVAVSALLALGLALSVILSLILGVNMGLILGISFALACLRIPIYFAESIWTWLHAIAARKGWVTGRAAAKRLPFLYHDVIWFPLPGLTSLLVHIVRESSSLGLIAIMAAAQSLGQKHTARLALHDFLALSLRDAARNRLYANVANLKLPLVIIESEGDWPVLAFRNAAKELDALTLTRSHHNHQRNLNNARRFMNDFRTRTIRQKRASLAARKLLPVSELWLQVIDDEQAKLDQRKREQPQVPTPFIAGSVLKPEDFPLFRGRRDLVRLIEHDIAGDRRVLLWLCGQRRMGKSSLVNMLPRYLGAATQLVIMDFQHLSGSGHLDAPHIWLEERIMATCGDRVPKAPGEPAWGRTLEWLRAVDERLAVTGERMLVVMDEIERLQDEIARGRATTDFLDFLRAAGNALERVRILIISAYAPSQLGAYWADRLISVVQHVLSYIEPEEARELICHPIDDFPDIYPEGGVERLIEATRCQPYLIQLICDELCKYLNGQQRLKATLADIDRCIAVSIGKTSLFQQLWQQRGRDEQAWLARLAETTEPVPRPDRALKELIRDGYVEERDGCVHVAVPMFARWLSEHRIEDADAIEPADIKSM